MEIKTILDVRKYLIEREIAYADEIFGCNYEEISCLEETYGMLPSSYKHILRLMGKLAGTFVFYDEFTFYFDDICECNEAWKDPNSSLPHNSFVILERYGADTHFILTGQQQDDCVVFYLSERDNSISLACNSIWNLLEGLLLDARKHTRDDYSYLDYIQDYLKYGEKRSSDGIRPELPDYYKNRIKKYRAQ